MGFSLWACLCPDTSHIGFGATYPSITSLHLRRPFSQINPRFEVLRVRTSTNEFFVADAFQPTTPPMVMLGHLRKVPPPSSASQSVTSPSLPGHFLRLAPGSDHLLCLQTVPFNSHLLFPARSPDCPNPGQESGSGFPLIPSGDVRVPFPDCCPASRHMGGMAGPEERAKEHSGQPGWLVVSGGSSFVT